MIFKQLKVIRKLSLTNSTVLITFEVPDKLEEFFHYLSGQYVTVKIKGENGVENSRCYSLCGDIKEKHISIAVKKVPNGIVSNYLCDDLLIGNILEVSKADGNFTIEKTNGFEKENCVFISAGSGITPIKSMIENLVSKHYKGNIYLIYGNNNESEIIFKSFLETIQHENKKHYKFKKRAKAE